MASREFDETLLERADAGGAAARAAASAGAHLRAGRAAALEADTGVLEALGRPRALVLAGAGAEAVAADVAAAALSSGSPVPVQVVRGRRLPGWVGAADLVVAVSGRTGPAADPVAACVAEAVRRGCSLAAAGPPDGPLAALAEQSRAVYAPLRGPATLWGPVGAALALTAAAGVPAPSAEAVEAAAVRMDEVAAACAPSVENWENEAKTLAADLAGTLPLVCGSTAEAAAAARCFAARAAAVAAYPVLAASLPEALGTAAVALSGPLGAEGPRSIFDDPVEDAGVRLHPVLLEDPDGGPDAEGDLAALRDAAHAAGARVSVVSAAPGDRMERLAGLIALTDYATVYLAAAYQVETAADEPSQG
ncbi:SIS domain-containing protein [Nocardiopsis chromatogenes]|uniref:SIS domain-containing protein n=1 Tax=Nocardiopsis chromatogenes TaxID=280239 RepID=UPI00034A2B22|nr:SIS domain-containing protein [Nocardiopsis chromatogenes]